VVQTFVLQENDVLHKRHKYRLVFPKYTSKNPLLNVHILPLELRIQTTVVATNSLSQG